MSFQILGAQQEKLLCPKLLLQRGTVAQKTNYG